MTEDDLLKQFRDQIARGEPIQHTVVDVPFKISLSDGSLQIDAHTWIDGIDEAAVHRITIAIPLNMFRLALETLQKEPNDVLTLMPSAPLAN